MRPIPSSGAPGEACPSWLDGWKGVRHYGAIAWASTTRFRGQTWWHLSPEDLAAWDRTFVEHAHLKNRPCALLPGFPMAAMERDRYDLMGLHTLSNELLARIREQVLFQHLERYYSRHIPYTDEEHHVQSTS